MGERGGVLLALVAGQDVAEGTDGDVRIVSAVAALIRFDRQPSPGDHAASRVADRPWCRRATDQGSFKGGQIQMEEPPGEQAVAAGKPPDDLRPPPRRTRTCVALVFAVLDRQRQQDLRRERFAGAAVKGFVLVRGSCSWDCRRAGSRVVPAPDVAEDRAE